MFPLLEKRIAAAISARIQTLYGLETAAQIEQPKQSSFGELALPAAFQLARHLKKAPKAIAAEIDAAGGPIEGVASMEIAGNGYLNVRLDRGAYGLGVLTNEGAVSKETATKTIVEHTNINPNKAAH